MTSAPSARSMTLRRILVSPFIARVWDIVRGPSHIPQPITQFWVDARDVALVHVEAAL